MSQSHEGFRGSIAELLGYPQLKRCKHLMLQLFEAITSVYQPHEVNTCHSQESRNLWVFDKAEAELDGMLGLKGKEIHYA